MRRIGTAFSLAFLMGSMSQRVREMYSSLFFFFFLVSFCFVSFFYFDGDLKLIMMA